MNEHLILAASGGLADIARSTGEAFGFNWSLFISQAISFAIVAFLLQRFAYKPILAVLEERRERIARSLENAEKIKQELASAQARSQELLKEAGVQANKIIEEARTAAAKISETESQRAVKAAEEIITKARQAAEADRDRLMAELKREVGHLAVKAAMQVTGKMLTAEDQQRLAEETNKQLAA